MIILNISTNILNYLKHNNVDWNYGQYNHSYFFFVFIFFCLFFPPDHARILSKQRMRESYVQQLRDNRDQDLKDIVEVMTKTETQYHIAKFLENLKNKR